MASTTDPSTWAPLEAVLFVVGFDGIGYVFSVDDPYCGIDLDHCRNGSGLVPDAAVLVLKLDSYSEWSPSGKGAHVLVRARVPGPRRRKGQVEMYDAGRFFAMTGDHIEGTPTTVEERQAELEAIYAAIFPAGQEISPDDDWSSATGLEGDDEELLERARAARNGAAFEALWNGDTAGYGSHSEADLALCGLLAFWTGPDPARIDSVFRRSGLTREKWDSRRGESTYGAQTVAKALENRSDFYSSTTSSHLVPSSSPGREFTTSSLVPYPVGDEVVDDLVPQLVPSSSRDERGWHPLDLVSLGTAAPEPPAIAELFYVGRRHVVTGESETAKTWLLLAAAAVELRERRGVVWVDGDLVGAGDLLERLRGLGVADDAIRDGFLYFVPEQPLGDSADLVKPLQARGGHLVVLDGFNPLLFLHGCDPDKGVGIESFMRRVANPLRDAGAAVVLSDNVAKAREARGSWAIGSERKKSAVEVQLGMTMVEPFGRGRTGKFKLTVHKDRPGYLERPSPGLFVLASDPGSGRCSWRIEPDHSVSEEGAFRPTNLMEKVSRYLELRPEPCSRKQIEDDVKGKGSGIRTAIDRLVEEGFAVEFAGERNTRLVKSIEAFRETDEWEGA